MELHAVREVEEKNTKPFPTLDQVLEYNNQDVIDGLKKSFDISDETAQELFTECLKWLWYCCNSKTVGSRSIDAPLAIIDEVWHTFVLYTIDYLKFCHYYFGRFIHHSPTTKMEITAFRKKSKEIIELDKRTQYELIYDVLGKETFILWYHVFPETYSKENILKMRLR